MAARALMNVGLEVMCIMVCAILLIHQLMMKNHRDTDRWFQYAIVFNIGMMLGDLTDWFLSGSSLPWGRPVLTIGMVLFYACSGGLLFSFFAYIYYYWQDRLSLSSGWLWAARVLRSAQYLLALISPFTGAVFFIGPDCVYSRGPFFMLSQLTAAATYLMALCIYLFAFKMMNQKEKVCFAIYLATPAIAELIQVLNYGLVLLNLSVTMAFLLVNLFINTELEDRLRASEQALAAERVTALRQRQQTQAKLVEETITALSNAVEAKDWYTNGHSRRVAEYSREIVQRMGWSPQEQQNVYYTGLLHDIGKIRIPDAIINKVGRLTDQEYEEVKLHTLTGYHALKGISSISEFAIGARWHHERYDGKGYPNGLSGENIPLVARVISVADAYDAMTSTRSYRSLMPQAKVRAEIEKGMGTQFDPHIAKIMLDMIDQDKDYRLRQPDAAVGQTILVIGDDPQVAQLLEEALPPENACQIITADSAEQGILLVKRQQVDLVMLDISTEGADGLDILAWIRQQKLDIPVVVVTQIKDVALFQRAEAMGVSDYLTKPLSKLGLHESVVNVLLHAHDSTE